MYITVSYTENSDGGGGRIRLPKFKFSAKIPICLHVILKREIKKIKIWLNQMQNIFQPEIRWNSFKWALFSDYTVIRMPLTVLPSTVAKWNWAIPTPSGSVQGSRNSSFQYGTTECCRWQKPGGATVNSVRIELGKRVLPRLHHKRE